jgi:glycosyltransferase involved in cell wall biosynthesis
MQYPNVSCLCPTFGRPPDYLHLLQEAVESFKRQDYKGQMELIVLNDCPSQTLTCDVEGVKIVNLRERLNSLGDKYNLMLRLAVGDVCLPWDDDDISLPGRVSQAVERLGDAHYWNPQRSFFFPSGGIIHVDHSHGVCHNASIYQRGCARRIQYPKVSGTEDQEMDRRLKNLGPIPDSLGSDPSEWQYIYRWGVSPVHISGFPDTNNAYIEIGKRSIQAGTFQITPRWYQDYLGMAKTAIAASSVTKKS